MRPLGLLLLIGVGLELSADVGPLVAPFSATYVGLHVTALFAWGQ